MNPANSNSSSKRKDLRKDGGLQIRKMNEKSWVYPKDNPCCFWKERCLMMETALDLGLTQECNQGEHKAKATPGSMFIKMMDEKTGFFFSYLAGICTGRVIVTINSLGRLSQHKVWFPSALTYAMALLTLVLHEVQLWGWWAGAPQALTQFELLCPQTLLGADDGNLQSRGRAAGITHPAWPLPISGVQGHPSHQPHPEKSSPRQLGCSHLVQPMCTEQKDNWFPAAAVSHQRESATLLLTRPFPSVDVIPGWKSWQAAVSRSKEAPWLAQLPKQARPSSQVNAFTAAPKTFWKPLTHAF